MTWLRDFGCASNTLFFNWICRYAREDTHYLLYIYQRMKCELCEKEGKEGIAAVFDACRDVCLLRYFKEGEFCSLGRPSMKLFKQSFDGKITSKLKLYISLLASFFFVLHSFQP